MASASRPGKKTPADDVSDELPEDDENENEQPSESEAPSGSEESPDEDKGEPARKGAGKKGEFQMRGQKSDKRKGAKKRHTRMKRPRLMREVQPTVPIVFERCSKKVGKCARKSCSKTEDKCPVSYDANGKQIVILVACMRCWTTFIKNWAEDHEWKALVLEMAVNKLLDAEFEESCLIVFDNMDARLDLSQDEVSRRDGFRIQVSKRYVGIDKDGWSDDIAPATITPSMANQIMSRIQSEFGDAKKYVIAREKSKSHIKIKILSEMTVHNTTTLLDKHDHGRRNLPSIIYDNEKKAMRQGQPACLRGHANSKCPTIDDMIHKANIAGRIVAQENAFPSRRRTKEPLALENGSNDEADPMAVEALDEGMGDLLKELDDDALALEDQKVKDGPSPRESIAASSSQPGTPGRGTAMPGTPIARRASKKFESDSLKPENAAGAGSDKKRKVVAGAGDEIERLHDLDATLLHLKTMERKECTGSRRYALERFKVTSSAAKIEKESMLALYKACEQIADPAFEKLPKENRKTLWIAVKDVEGLDSSVPLVGRAVKLHVQDAGDDMEKVVDAAAAWGTEESDFKMEDPNVSNSKLPAPEKETVAITCLVNTVAIDLVTTGKTGVQGLGELADHLESSLGGARAAGIPAELETTVKDFELFTETIRLLLNPDPASVAKSRHDLGKVKALLQGKSSKQWNLFSKALKGNEYFRKVAVELEKGITHDGALKKKMDLALKEAGDDLEKIGEVILKLPAWAKQCRTGGTANMELELMSKLTKKMNEAKPESGSTFTVADIETLSKAFIDLETHCRKAMNEHNRENLPKIQKLRQQATKLKTSYVEQKRTSGLTSACTTFLDTEDQKAQLETLKEHIILNAGCQFKDPATVTLLLRTASALLVFICEHRPYQSKDFLSDNCECFVDQASMVVVKPS